MSTLLVMLYTKTIATVLSLCSGQISPFIIPCTYAAQTTAKVRLPSSELLWRKTIGWFAPGMSTILSPCRIETGAVPMYPDSVTKNVQFNDIIQI